jgi:uncharacterized membrane protein
MKRALAGWRCSVPKALVIASIGWPLLLGAAVWQRHDGARPAWTTVVYAAASRVCHQLPDRSFASAGVQWPVCARCSGLYLAAPLGALAAWRWRPRSSAGEDRARWWLVAASVPTALTLGVQWLGLEEPANLTRALAALPLGTMIGFVLVRTAASPPRPIG